MGCTNSAPLAEHEKKPVEKKSTQPASRNSVGRTANQAGVGSPTTAILESGRNADGSTSSVVLGRYPNPLDITNQDQSHRRPSGATPHSIPEAGDWSFSSSSLIAQHAPPLPVVQETQCESPAEEVILFSPLTHPDAAATRKGNGSGEDANDGILSQSCCMPFPVLEELHPSPLSLPCALGSSDERNADGETLHRPVPRLA
jgi:hypothetical protein